MTNTTAPPGGRRKAPRTTTPRGLSKTDKPRSNFSAAPDAAQVADGVSPFARFKAVWAASITPPSCKLVLLALTDFADADGTNIRPSVATVARMCGISPKQARRYIRDLEKLDVLRETKKGVWTAGTYALDFAALAALPRVGVPPVGVPYATATPPTNDPHPSHEWETTPVITRGTTRVITGGQAPTGSGLAPVPSGACPERADADLWGGWVKRARWNASTLQIRVNEGNSLTADGYDINAMLRWLLDEPVRAKYKDWPVPDTQFKVGKPKSSRQRQRRGGWAAPTLDLPTGSPEEQEAAYLGVTP